MENMIGLTILAVIATTTAARGAPLHSVPVACRTATHERGGATTCTSAHRSRIHGYTRESKGL